MTFKCLGCKKSFPRKIGLSNHWRACTDWKNYDMVTLRKKRRLEQQEQPETVQTESSVQVADDDLSMEV